MIEAMESVAQLERHIGGIGGRDGTPLAPVFIPARDLYEVGAFGVGVDEVVSGIELQIGSRPNDGKRRLRRHKKRPDVLLVWADSGGKAQRQGGRRTRRNRLRNQRAALGQQGGVAVQIAVGAGELSELFGIVAVVTLRVGEVVVYKQTLEDRSGAEHFERVEASVKHGAADV